MVGVVVVGRVARDLVLLVDEAPSSVALRQAGGTDGHARRPRVDDRREPLLDAADVSREAGLVTGTGIVSASSFSGFAVSFSGEAVVVAH